MTDLLENETTDTEETTEIPAKFVDPETGAVNVGSLVNSYKALEKKLSGMVPAPDTEEGRARINKMTGVPDRAEDYCINCEHGLFTEDPDVNKKLLEKGFTNDQAQAVYDIAAERFVPLVAEMAGEFKAEREVERLIAAFGGADRWKEVSRQLLAFGQKNLPAEVLESMSGSFEGVMMLYKMMKSRDPDIARVSDGAEAAGGANEKDLQSMMRDPRYWRDKDPQFVAKVTEGFKRVYEGA